MAGKHLIVWAGVRTDGISLPWNGQDSRRSDSPTFDGRRRQCWLRTARPVEADDPVGSSITHLSYTNTTGPTAFLVALAR